MVRDEIIGNSRRDLVLKTAGVIRVLVGDKYYNLDFRSEKDDNNDNNESNKENDFIIANSIDDYINGSIAFPGNNKIIFTLDGNIYYTKNSGYKKYDIVNNQDNSNDDDDNDGLVTEYDVTVNFNAAIPFHVDSKRLIPNLNAEYLDGMRASDFIQNKNNINLKSVTVNSIKSSDGKFSYENGVFKYPKDNSLFYKSLSEDYILDFPNITDYSIKGNGFKVIIPDEYKNGDSVCIYTIDNCRIEYNDKFIISESGEYNKFVCMPVDDGVIKWVYITDNYFIEYN